MRWAIYADAATKNNLHASAVGKNYQRRKTKNERGKLSQTDELVISRWTGNPRHYITEKAICFFLQFRMDFLQWLARGE